MNDRRFTILCFLLLLLIAQRDVAQAQAQWQPGYGPMLSNINCTVLGQGGYIAAGTQGRGVLISTDDGASWLPSTGVLGYEFIHSVAVTEKGVILAAGSAGIYESNDSGQSWTTLNLNCGHVYSFLTIRGKYLLDAAPEQYVLAATDSGILYSDNKATSWSTFSWMMKTRVTAITRRPGGSLAAINGSKAAYSVDGDVWILSPLPKRPRNFNAICALSNADLLLGTDSGVYVSHDSGFTWLDYSSAMDKQTVQSIAQDSSGDIFVGLAPGGLRRTQDNGANWTTIFDDTTGMYSTDVDVRASGEIYYATASDFYISSDRGDHWRRSPGIVTERTTALAVTPNGTIFAGTKTDGFYTSSDGGVSWIHSGYVNTGVTSMRTDNRGRAYAAMQGSYGAVISTDGGHHWAAAKMPVGDHYYAIAIGSDGEVYLAGTADLYRSTDGGSTFIDTYFYNTTRSLLGDPSGYVFAGGTKGVYRSTGNGAAWQQCDTGLTIKTVSALAITRRGTLVAGGAFGAQRSTNSGSSWQPCDSSLQNVSISCFTNAGDGSIFLGSDSGVFRSTDDGISWQRYNDGLPPGSVQSMATDSEGYIYASYTNYTPYDVYRTTTPIKQGVRTSQARSTDVFLVPNPMDRHSTLRYTLAASSRIKIEMFNGVGMSMGVLADEFDTKGEHQLNIDVARLSTGAYYLLLRTAAHSTVIPVCVQR